MNENIKKIAIGLIAGGSLMAGGNAVLDKMNCDFVIESEGKEICIDKEVAKILESKMPISKGFGGIGFGQK